MNNSYITISSVQAKRLIATSRAQVPDIVENAILQNGIRWAETLRDAGRRLWIGRKWIDHEGPATDEEIRYWNHHSWRGSLWYPTTEDFERAGKKFVKWLDKLERATTNGDPLLLTIADHEKLVNPTMVM